MPARGSSRPAHVRVLERIKYQDDCWVYGGWGSLSGYGRVTLGDSDKPGVATNAHRAVYEALVGPVPDGFELDHLCRNRRCVNPDHLEPISHAENVKRGYWGKNHCKHGHAYDEVNTRWYVEPRGGKKVRVCRQCERIRHR